MDQHDGAPTVADLIRLGDGVRDAVDHDRAIRDEHDDPSRSDVIAAYHDRVRAFEAWWHAYSRATPNVRNQYIARIDPANGARRDAS